MSVIHYYKVPGLSDGATAVKLEAIKEIHPETSDLKTESCFNIQVKRALSSEDEKKLKWILGCPRNPNSISTSSFLDAKRGEIIEIGPRSVNKIIEAIEICNKKELVINFYSKSLMTVTYII